MWFYGLVGNNQARDPWLDESFAVYAEVLANDNAGVLMRLPTPPKVRNRVGESMQWYARLHSPDLYGVRRLPAGRCDAAPGPPGRWIRAPSTSFCATTSTPTRTR